MKAISDKSVVLINCRKINHQQKNTFIMSEQLNGLVLKSLKTNRKKNWLSWAWSKILNFATGRAELGPKF